MNTKLGFALAAVFLLSGCEGVMEKQRQIEAQQQAAQIQLAQIQAETQMQIAATQAEARRKSADHRTDRIIELLGFIVFLATPVAAMCAWLAYRARVTQLQLAAAIQISQQLAAPERAAVVAGLLTASGVNSRTLYLEHQRL